MDENSFVKYLKSEFPFTSGTGIGDDASIIKKGPGYQVITNDILIEGVHFDLSYFSFEEIGSRALAVNLSDIAAMGGVPEYFFLGLGLPGHLKEKELKTFFKGIKSGCSKWGVELAGGDLSTSHHGMFISITMVGNSFNPTRRDGAKVGDLIGLTRGTGEAAVGLELLKKGIDIPEFSRKHKCPEPEVIKGKLLSLYVNSMIDVSDGLVMDLERVLQSSGLGGKIFYEKIPVTNEMKTTCDKYGLEETELVLAGGEDFSLLFTISPEKEIEMKKTGINYYIIGNIINGSGLKIERHKKLFKLNRKGFDHFE